MKALLTGLKNVLLWSYARGTWQYDALCALIVLTLLVWPGHKPNANERAVTQTAPTAGGLQERELEWQDLRAFLQKQNRLELLNSPREAVALYLQSEFKTAVTLAALEPYGDAQGHSGYRVRYRLN